MSLEERTPNTNIFPEGVTIPPIAPPIAPPPSPQLQQETPGTTR